MITPYEEGYLDGLERKYNNPYEKDSIESNEYNWGHREGEKIAIAEYNEN